MENPAEVVPPQTPAPVTTPQVGEVVSVPKEELDDLRHRAEVSSQNFERLKKEQERSAELEASIAELQAQPVLSGQNDEAISKLSTELADIKAKQARSEVLEAHPQLKEVWDDFEKFRADEDNKGMNLKTAAKAFLVEKGLLDKPRQGLERPTGGDRTPVSSGMSVEDVKKLRENDYKKYRELVKKGIIQIS